MSFFRVLLALLISAGIAYGLYRVVDGQGVERAVEAVRTEIQEPKEAASDTETAAMTETLSGTDEGGEAAVEAQATEETGTENADAADDTGTAMVTAESDAAPDADADASSDGDWAARVESATDDAPETDAPSPAMSATADQAEGGATATLPAVSLADTTSASVDALKIVTGGMRYSEALTTLTQAGWQPRTLTNREGEPSATEAVLLEAGYGELESCKGDERPICRFEFIDGAKRIAAVITAGTGTDPGVIDAFLMDIATE